MTIMLNPDLIDRRALALIRLVDSAGRPVTGPVRIEGLALRSVRKADGYIAIVSAEGLAAHEASFDAAPASPTKGSKAIPLEITPSDPTLAPRRYVLRLPRDPDPVNAANADSLFAAQPVTLLPSPRTKAIGSAAILRVSVTRKSDGALVENALVRAQSDDGQMNAMALTDAAGEAALLFPFVPLTFPGAGATVTRNLTGRVVVHADPASARFATPATLAIARTAAAGRLTDHADPDAIAAKFAPAFGSGEVIAIMSGGQPAISLQWSAP